MAEYPMEFAEKRVRDETLAPYPRTEARMREELCDYYAMITHLDHQIGRMIDALKRTGQWENTIIILCGDNGLAIGSHALMGKQNHFEHSLKVPLLFAGPTIPVGRRVGANVFLSDIFATLCDVLQISIPSSVQGNSFLSCFTEPTHHRKVMYHAYGDTIRSIRDGEWKLSEYLGETGKLSTLLYNVNSDPMELHNLHQEDSPISGKLRHALRTLSITEGDTDRPESARFWQRYDRARSRTN
jgi:arylsulfatase A-like enzyme